MTKGPQRAHAGGFVIAVDTSELSPRTVLAMSSRRERTHFVLAEHLAKAERIIRDLKFNGIAADKIKFLASTRQLQGLPDSMCFIFGPDFKYHPAWRIGELAQRVFDAITSGAEVKRPPERPMVPIDLRLPKDTRQRTPEDVLSAKELAREWLREYGEELTVGEELRNSQIDSNDLWSQLDGPESTSRPVSFTSALQEPTIFWEALSDIGTSHWPRFFVEGPRHGQVETRPTATADTDYYATRGRILGHHVEFYVYTKVWHDRQRVIERFIMDRKEIFGV